METRSFIQFLLIMIGICVELKSSAQTITYKIEQVDSLMIHQPKPLLILLSTDWCHYCAIQKNQLQKIDQFKKQNDQFYYIEFNAEQKEPVDFMGNRYRFKPTGINIGTHELVTKLTGDIQTSFPTWVVVDKIGKTIFKHNGLLKLNEVENIIIALQQHLLK